MREILFRGKQADRWIYGSPIFQDNYVLIRFWNSEEFGYEDHLIFPETIGQYTGLTDKNGKKIFEGDIHCNENNNKKFVVKFGHFYDEELLDDMYGWYMEDNWGNRFGLNGSEYEYANIIGNIHDNPELLNN